MIGKYDPILLSNLFEYLKIARKMKNLSRFLVLPATKKKKNMETPWNLSAKVNNWKPSQIN